MIAAWELQINVGARNVDSFTVNCKCCWALGGRSLCFSSVPLRSIPVRVPYCRTRRIAEKLCVRAQQPLPTLQPLTTEYLRLPEGTELAQIYSTLISHLFSFYCIAIVLYSCLSQFRVTCAAFASHSSARPNSLTLRILRELYEKIGTLLTLV